MAAKNPKKNPKDTERAAFYRNQVIAWVRRFHPEIDDAIKKLAEERFPKEKGARKRIRLDESLESLGKEGKE